MWLAPTSRWTRKPPPQYSVLNRWHPQARGLVDMWLFNDGGVFSNVVHSERPLTTVSPSSLAPCFATAGIDGPCARTIRDSISGQTGSLIATNTASVNYASGDLTIRIRWMPINYNGGGFATVIEKGNSTREIGIFVNSSGNTSFINVGGGGGSVSGSEGMAQGSLYDFVLTRDVASGDVKTYVNGLIKSTFSALTPANTSGGADQLLLNKDGLSGGTQGEYQYFMLQIWSRVLTANEIINLYGDPYGMLMPPTPWWVGAQAAAAPDTLEWVGNISIPRQRSNINVMY